MKSNDRRNMLRAGLTFLALPGTLLHLGCTPNQESTSSRTEPPPVDHTKLPDKKTDPNTKGNTMQIQYLEIVTPNADAVCATYSKLHGVTFDEADANLGGARLAKLANGGMIGVRAPMRDTETPVVRPYLLVDDIQAAVKMAADSGAEIAFPPTELAGHGTFAIFIQDGIESGLCQL